VAGWGIRLVAELQTTSTSMLKRRLRLGCSSSM